MASQYEQAIQLAQAGQREQARQLFRQIVRREPDNEAAWQWLASVVDDQGEYQHVLREILRINPNNDAARTDLERLQLGQPAPPPLTSPPPAPPYPAAPPYQPGAASKAGRVWALPLLIVVLIAVIAGLTFAVIRLATDEDQDDSGTTESTASEDDESAPGGMFGSSDSSDDASDISAPGVPAPSGDAGDESMRKTVRFNMDFYSASVTVPQTWYLAARGDPEWSAKRSMLESAVPFSDADSGWGAIEADLTDLSSVQMVAIVETDVDTLTAGGAPSMIAFRGLVDPGTLNIGISAFDCTSVRSHADSIWESANTDSSMDVLDIEIQELSDDLCGLRVDMVMRLPDAEDATFRDYPPPAGMRMVTLVLPESADSAARWMVVVPDSLYGAFEHDIQVIIETAQIEPLGE